MKLRTKIRSFFMIAVVGLLLFGCYSQGPEIQPNPSTPPTQTGQKPKPKPTPTPKPTKQQGTEQQQQQQK
jgi:hypothetical protein